MLVVYRSLTLLPQAMRRAVTAPGECLILGDFNTPAVNWSNRTCPKSDGFDKDLLTTAEEEEHYHFYFIKGIDVTKPRCFAFKSYLYQYPLLSFSSVLHFCHLLAKVC